MFSFTHVVVSAEIVGWYTRTGVYLTGFAGTALGASSMAGGASLSGRGILTRGARGFCLGSVESAGTRVRLDLEAMDNDKSYLFSSFSPSFWLPPFFLTVRLLDWAARPALVAREGDLIRALDCGHGSRNPWLTPFRWPDGVRIEGKGIECVVDHPFLPLPLPLAVVVVAPGRLGLRVHDTPTSIYPTISDGLLSRGD
jgi:hypothetical protein